MKYRALQQHLRERAEMADPEEQKVLSAMADGAEDVLAQIKQSANLIAESRALLAEADQLLGRKARR